MDEAKIKAAKDAGYSDEEIAAYIASQKKSPSFVETKKKEAEQNFNQNVDSTKTEIFGAKVPTNLLGIGAAGAVGLGAGAYLANRKGSPPPTKQYEPTLNEPTFEAPKAEVNPAEQTRIAKQQAATQQINTPQSAPQPAANMAQPAANPVQALQEKLAAVQAAQPAPVVQVAPPVNNPLVSPESPKANAIAPVTGAPQVDPLHASIDADGLPKVPEVFKPAASTEPTITKTPAAEKARQKLTYKADDAATAKLLLKEGVTFMPAYGPGDNHLFNTYGNEGRKAVINQFNGGKPVGSYQNALDLETQVQGVRAGPVIPPAMRNERGIPRSEFGNFGPLGKSIKVGGIAGLGILAADLANAKTAGQVGEVAGNAAMGFAPPQVQAGIYSKNAGESPEDLQRLQYMNKVGAGRGVMPPSAYIPVDPRKQWEEMKKEGLVFGEYRGNR